MNRHLRESDDIDPNIFSKIIQIDQNYYMDDNNPILAAIKGLSSSITRKRNERNIKQCITTQ